MGIVRSWGEDLRGWWKSLSRVRDGCVGRVDGSGYWRSNGAYALLGVENRGDRVVLVVRVFVVVEYRTEEDISYTV